MRRSAVILISQTTTFFGQSYVEQVPHGGKKIEFGSSVMIRLTSSNSANAPKMGFVQRGDRLIQEPVGREVTAYIKKNKTGVPYREVKYDFYYQGQMVGVDRIKENVIHAQSLGVIEGTTWLTFTPTGQKWQGADNTAKAFKEDPDLYEQLSKEIHARETGEVLE